jgi:hypothetical protein
MSQANVRLVERAIAAINARDIEGHRASAIAETSERKRG